jgi:hypothetical protein
MELEQQYENTQLYAEGQPVKFFDVGVWKITEKEKKRILKKANIVILHCSVCGAEITRNNTNYIKRKSKCYVCKEKEKTRNETCYRLGYKFLKDVPKKIFKEITNRYFK